MPGTVPRTRDISGKKPDKASILPGNVESSEKMMLKLSLDECS